ncbi:MAG: metal-dependent hydrolase [Parvibaculaceae bacterium]
MSLSLVADQPRMTVRRVPFDFSKRTDAHWNPGKPEFSQVVNAASLAMPYLEPYLIQSMRKARDLISDEALRKELDLYVAQEATHFRQHKKFNQTVEAAGYAAVSDMEDLLDEDYAKLGRDRSLRFNLAYAEGFESMALAIGHMLIEDRVYLFGDSDPDVATLVLWHFVEEIEHKNVAFDVFEHLNGSYFWRMVGLFYATAHIFRRTGQGYRKLLKEDGLWWSLKSRWRLTKLLARIFKNLLPKLARICRPGYHPSQITDPDWGRAWATLFAGNPQASARIDTTRLHLGTPEPQTTA